jgi:hypothetical protein
MSQLDEVLARTIDVVPPRMRLESELLRIAVWQLEAAVWRIKILQALTSTGATLKSNKKIETLGEFEKALRKDLS